MGSQETKRKDMSFRDEVNSTTKSVMIETFITSLFSDPHRRFGDIIDDLLENNDPDDDWMKDTLYDLEVSQFVQAGMKILGLGLEDQDWERQGEDDGVIATEDEDGTTYSLDDSDEAEEEPDPKPKKKKGKKKKKKGKKKKKKKPDDDVRKPPRKKKSRNSVPAPSAKTKPADENDGNWNDYKKLVVKTLRAHRAYDGDTAVNNSVILNDIHGEKNWSAEESAQLRAAISELHQADKIDKVGKARGTRYHLN